MNLCHLLGALAKGLSKYFVRNAFRMIARDERDEQEEMLNTRKLGFERLNNKTFYS